MALGFQFDAFQSVGFQDGAGAPVPPVVEVTGQTPAGSLRHRRRYYVIRVKGEDHVFQTVDALVSFLARQEVEVEHIAKARAERDAQRVLRLGPKAQREQPKAPRVAMRSTVPEIADYIAQLQQRIDRVYRDALVSELAAQAEEEEDIMMIARML